MSLVTNKQPFEYLREVDERISSRHRDLREQDAHMQLHLHFCLKQHDLLLPIREGSEVVNEIEYTPAPASKSWMVGYANLRGDLLVLLDLQGFLFGQEDKQIKLKGKKIVVSRFDGLCMGILVDRVVGLKRVWDTDLSQNCPSNWDDSVVEFLAKVYQEEGSFFGEIDVKKIADSERFSRMRVY